MWLVVLVLHSKLVCGCRQFNVLHWRWSNWWAFYFTGGLLYEHSWKETHCTYGAAIDFVAVVVSCSGAMRSPPRERVPFNFCLFIGFGIVVVVEVVVVVVVVVVVMAAVCDSFRDDLFCGSGSPSGRSRCLDLMAMSLCFSAIYTWMKRSRSRLVCNRSRQQTDNWFMTTIETFVTFQVRIFFTLSYIFLFFKCMFTIIIWVATSSTTLLSIFLKMIIL